MKKLLAIILAVAMVMSMAVAVSADAPEEVTIANYNFDNGSAAGWAHHWGDWALSVTDDGMLHTEKGDMNVMFTTYTNLPALTAGTEYKVTADVYLCDNEYLVSKETGETATFESATFAVSIKTGGVDGTALASKKQTIVCGDTETFTFTYTPNADVTDAALCFNMDGSDWSLNGVSYCLDNVKITYALPEEAPEAIDVALYENEAGNTFTADATTYLDPWGGFGICSEVNGQNVGNISLPELITYAEMEGAELVITFAGGGIWGGSKPETEVQFNCWDTEEDLQVKFDIATLPSGVNKGVVKFEALISKLEALGLTTADIRNLGVQVWASEFKLHTVAIHVPAPEVEEETYRGSGYFMTGDETHAMIIGKAIITTPHEFNENGDCKYCRYHTEVVVEDIIVEQPTESTEEESEDITVEEPKEDTNPGTGLTLAVIPAIVALAAVVISKR